MVIYDLKHHSLRVLKGNWNLTASSTRLIEEKIGNLQRKIRRHQVVAIAEHDDGKAVVRKVLDGGAESHSFTVVPHATMFVIWIQKPAKTVRRRGAIGLLHAAIGYFHRCDRSRHLGRA